ncbi:hypothetical protein O181_066006 [Austropuccinia psidii MF-1]|uniref:Uncharacterized protein n=1 Tax=Austropuccinia psidii MF-1 TaxID=1389203 RepID=A0A9Q3EQ31_9BASI|nr:hypothetical protein [Austropuccinia psidii MF-1]
MEHIHEKATKINVCVENSQHPFIIEIGAQCSIVVKEYLEKHLPNWEKKLLPTQANNFKISAGKMDTIETIIKEIMILHRKSNIRSNPEFIALEDTHIQGFLL